MGHIIKLLKTVVVHKDNFQVCSMERAKELEGKNITEKRKGIGIIIYAEADDEFSYFYERHVLHRIQGGGEKVSVLTVNGTGVISQTDVRRVLESALRNAKFGSQVVSTRVPQVLLGSKVSIREWNFSTRGFIGEEKDCCFIFRDILDVTARKKLYEVANKIPKKEFEEVVQKIDDTCRIGAEFVIQYIWFIQKYFVAY